MLCIGLHLPIKDYDLEPNIENDETEIKEENDPDNNYELEVNYDPRNKVNYFIEKIISNCKNHWILGKEITIDETMVAFWAKSLMKFLCQLNQTNGVSNFIL